MSLLTMFSLRQTVSRIITQKEFSTQTSVAVIKVPKYVDKYILKLKERKETRRLAVLRKIKYPGDKDVPVIRSTNKEYNFYLGQVYNKKLPIPIMSKYWNKPKTAGQKFTITPWDKNPALPMKLEKPEAIMDYCSEDENMSFYRSEFHELKLSPTMVNALQHIGFEYPTPIQAMAVPQIVTRDHVLCVSETGSGKTMAYLAPIIDNLMRCKDKQARFNNTPLALVICPGRELAEQIAMEAHRLGEICGVSVKLLIPEGTQHKHLKPVHYEPFDLLVATFGTILRLSNKGVIFLSHLKHIVLDEADTLLDLSFKFKMDLLMSYIMPHDTILNPEGRDFGAQIIFSSSTIPSNIENFFHDAVREVELKRVISPFTHRILPHVSQKFLRVNHANRAGTALEIIKKDSAKGNAIMVFCNSTYSCDWLYYFLKESDVPSVRFHAAMEFQERYEAFERFQSGDVDVLCCTDLASRGLDTQRTNHVLNFDFPNNMSDYILRTGRVGRVGSNKGHVTSLLAQKSSIYVVQDIELAVRRSSQLENVDANIKQKLEKMYQLATR